MPASSQAALKPECSDPNTKAARSVSLVSNKELLPSSRLVQIARSCALRKSLACSVSRCACGTRLYSQQEGQRLLLGSVVDGSAGPPDPGPWVAWALGATLGCWTSELIAASASHRISSQCGLARPTLRPSVIEPSRVGSTARLCTPSVHTNNESCVSPPALVVVVSWILSE